MANAVHPSGEESPQRKMQKYATHNILNDFSESDLSQNNESK